MREPNWLTVCFLPFALAGALACSQATDRIDRRMQSGAAAATLDPSEGTNSDAPTEVGNSRDTNAVIDDEPISLLDPVLQPAAGSEFLSEDFLSNVTLLSRIDRESIVFFGTDGRSWLYGVDGEIAPIEVSPVVAVPEEGSLFSMTEDDFWMLTPTRLSKRKQEESLAPEQVVLINFDITQLSGDPNQMRVLGVSRQNLILYMGSHIAVFEVIGDDSSAFEFKAEFPPGTGSEILAAGRLTNGGYWLATDQNLATLRRVSEDWVWNVVQSEIAGASLLGLAAELNFDDRTFVGDVAAWTTNGVFSVSGLPIAAEPASEP